MEKASLVHDLTEASKGTFENAEQFDSNGQKLNTPPTSNAELCSPASSSKRGRLRAASLVGSPSAARGLGNPSAGFGAGLQNVPSPITTAVTLRHARNLESIKADGMREPLPGIQLPGIAETLKDLAPSPANQPSLTPRGHPAPVTEQRSIVPPSESGMPNRDSQENNLDIGDAARILSIYTRRADQIGLSHRIPGIGHLGDLLPPPGWKYGDGPISEAEAQRIFTVSRSQAKDMLDQSVSEVSHLSRADQEKVSAEKNAQYQAQRLLDECLLMERIKIYHWYQREHMQPQKKNLHPQQRTRFEPKPAIRPQPLQPPAETSMIAYQRHQRLLVPASPHLYAPSPPLSGGILNARINFMMQGLHIPPASPMSPTFLDPGLVPQTLEAVYNCYARNQVIIMNMNNENERFMTQWSAKFHVPRPQDPAMPGVIPFITGQRAAPFGSVHYGYVPQNPRPWTPSQARFGGIPEPGAQTQPARQFSSVSNQSNLRQIDGKTSSYPVNQNGPFRYPNRRNYSPQRKPQVTKIPESKKRDRAPKADKGKNWYADEVAEANLPTSVISQAAMKAGMEFRTNEDRKQTPPKPRGRRGMPVIDARKGFAVSADAAKALIAKGATDARPRDQPVAQGTSIATSVSTIAPSTGIVAGFQARSYSSAGNQTTSVPTLQQDEDTISAPNSAVSGPSSDTPDDPKDTNYGQRAPRKPATTQTTAVPRKPSSTVGKKRKSTEAVPSAKKRTRHSVDGAEGDK